MNSVIPPREHQRTLNRIQNVYVTQNGRLISNDGTKDPSEPLRKRDNRRLVEQIRRIRQRRRHPRRGTRLVKLLDHGQ
ncbi:hypothetical protein ACIQYW_34020, partial [Rhodococcus erythropolis]